MIIKIVAGVFGNKVGNRIVPVTAGDDPIEVSAEIGRRLVAGGLAVVVSEQEQEEPHTETVDVGDEDDGEKSDPFPDFNESMTKAELIEIALSVGIEETEINDGMKKSDILEMLEEARADYDAMQTPPSFNPEGDML